MNKILTLRKAFYGLIIYFALAFIYNFILKNYQNLNPVYYNIIIISHEIITVILLIIVFRKRLKKDFIDFDKNYNNYLSLGVKVWILGLILMVVSNKIIYSFIIDNISYNQAVNVAIINRLPLYSVISMLLCGPFIEEIVFRLSFKNALTNKKLYYVLSILIFTSMHVLNGISSPIELLFFIPYGSMAFAFTYILDKTDNIFTSVVIHTIHNALTIVSII